MKTRVIHTKIWKDPYYHSLKIDEAHFFIFLLTNENINMVGTYELCDEEITLWVKIPPKRLQEIKQKFQRDNKFIFSKGWVKVVNHEKYNSYGNGSSQQKAYERELALVPALDTSMDTSVYTGGTPDIIPKSKTIIQKEGGTGGESYIPTEKDFKEIGNQFGLHYNIVSTTFDKVRDYEKSSGKRYKDYLAAIRNYLRRDIESGRLKAEIKTYKLKDRTFTTKEDWLAYAKELKVCVTTGGERYDFTN